MKTLLAALQLALAASALASSTLGAKPASPASPLFSSDAPIQIRIQGPMATLASNRNETPYPATLVAEGVTYPITLTPRGITRLKSDTCEFPPLRVEFNQAAPPGSLFHGQKKLKLVTHCKKSVEFQQKVMLEYSAYRLYNLITPQSFRARAATIEYVDDAGRPFVTRAGFFIEDFGDVAKRNGLTNAHLGSLVPLARIDRAASARFAVFEYMISNYDWSMRASPKGEECCHNGRLLAGAPGGVTIPVPYDFDYSGLVDAPYAGPPEGVPTDNVRQRNYRGYCQHIPEARAFGAQLAPRRAEFTGLFASIPGLDPRNQARASAYIDTFFNDLASGKIFKSCVN